MRALQCGDISGLTLCTPFSSRVSRSRDGVRFPLAQVALGPHILKPHQQTTMAGLFARRIRASKSEPISRRDTPYAAWCPRRLLAWRRAPRQARRSHLLALPPCRATLRLLRWPPRSPVRAPGLAPKLPAISAPGLPGSSPWRRSARLRYGQRRARGSTRRRWSPTATRISSLSCTALR